MIYCEYHIHQGGKKTLQVIVQQLPHLSKISFKFLSDKKIQSLNFSTTKTAGAFVVQAKVG